jgi:hypothetical protein
MLIENIFEITRKGFKKRQKGCCYLPKWLNALLLDLQGKMFPQFALKATTYHKRQKKRSTMVMGL